MTSNFDPSYSTPVDPTRVRKFAEFFKNYMSVSAVLAAALPIPVTSLSLIPTYKAQTSLLSTYTSLFCFLLLGFIFYSRHALARRMFPEFFGWERTSARASLSIAVGPLLRLVVSVLPALLILGSLICVFYYHSRLDRALESQLQPIGVVSRSISVSIDEPEKPRIEEDLEEGPYVPEFPNAIAALEKTESWQIPGG